MAHATTFSLLDKRRYKDHLQNNEYVLEVSNGLKKIDRSISGQTGRIAKSQQKATQELASNIGSEIGELKQQTALVHQAVMHQTEAIGFGLNVINDSMDRGFFQVSNQLSDLNSNILLSSAQIQQGIHGLQSSFEMGMSAIVSQFELQRKELADGFKTLTNLLKNSEKTKAMEAFLDGKKSFEKYLQFPDEPLFLDNAIESLENSISIYKDNAYAYLYLGQAYLKNSDHYSEDSAIEHYAKCVTYARGSENTQLAGLGSFLGGWACYVNGQVEEAVKLTHKSLDFDPNNSSAHFYLAKYYAYQKNADASIRHLDEAKIHDPEYLLRVSDDPDFSNIQSELGEFFERIRDKERQRWLDRLDSAGIVLKGGV